MGILLAAQWYALAVGFALLALSDIFWYKTNWLTFLTPIVAFAALTVFVASTGYKLSLWLATCGVA